jgi:hypothetical protein
MVSPFSKTALAEWLAAKVATDHGQPSEVEAWRGIGCLLRWLETVRSEKSAAYVKSVFGDLERLVIHVDHSSLLRRLLHGKEPLPRPPPLSCGYPWYELIETGEGIAFGVCEWPHESNEPCLLIN